MWESTSGRVEDERIVLVTLHAIKYTQLQGQRRVDGVGTNAVDRQCVYCLRVNAGLLEPRFDFCAVKKRCIVLQELMSED